jgi:hypothetical protein
VFRISAGTPATVSDVFRVFPPSLHKNSGIVPRLGSESFLSNPSHFIISRASYHFVLHDLDKVLRVK